MKCKNKCEKGMAAASHVAAQAGGVNDHDHRPWPLPLSPSSHVYSFIPALGLAELQHSAKHPGVIHLYYLVHDRVKHPFPFWER